MFRRRGLVLVVAAVLMWVIPGMAAAQYPVQGRLCDVAYQNCRTQILDLINAESQSIDVGFWFMEDARYSNALINAKNRGVKIRVLFDTEAFSGKDAAIRQQIIQSLQNAGIPLKNKTSSGIVHWKAMVFGGQHIVNFSAANFSSVGYVPIQPYVDYEDEVVVFTVESSLVSSFKTRFDDIWTTTSGYQNYANITELTREHPTTPIDSRLNFAPFQNYMTRARTRYDAETVGIDVTMYRITDIEHTKAMLRAVQRGVPVRLYTEQEQYRDPARLWHSYNVDIMYAAGVQVKHRAHLGLNHQKSVILHGQGMVIHGSSNWTTPSASSQLEHNLFTTDASYYTWFVDQFNRKWNNTGPAPETTAFVPLPADKPLYNAPANGAAGLGIGSVTLKWNAGLWAHKYDIYFGTSTSPDLIAADVELGPSETATSYRTYTVPGPLLPGTTYYWKVVSKTMANMTRAGDLWSFATAGSSPTSELPEGWAHTDIGAVAAAGGAAHSGGLFTLSASGADIWGTADEFHFAYKSMSGNGDVIARVAGITNEHPWTKAGVMIRSSLTPGAAHATMFVSASKGLAFQRRVASGGASTSTAGPAGTAPYWVKISRAGDLFTASISTNGTAWTVIDTDTIPMGGTVLVGLALTSHLDGTLSTATFDSVSIGGSTPPPPPPPPSLPGGWATDDVGATSPAGSASWNSGTNVFSVSGSGADIWGTADAFRFAYTNLEGDGEIVARVSSVQNVDPWVKAGVMMRDGLLAGAAHASMFVTPSTVKGTAFQRRPVAGGSSVSTTGPAVAPPYWVRLVRTGNMLAAYTSPDGATWSLVGTQTATMGATIQVGLVVSSHKTGTLATATFDNVTVTAY